MAGQLEFNLRAMLCRQLAKREPENRILWMAEAESWSRLSKDLRGDEGQHSAPVVTARARSGSAVAALPFAARIFSHRLRSGIDVR